MASTINTNIMSINAQRNLATSQSSLGTSMQRLSSGMRVNSAKDDAAGLAIATRMDAQARGMTVAIRNANDAIGLAQTADGALGKVGDMLQRMRELAVQSANGTNSTSDRANLDAEYQELGKEVTRTLQNTKFNGIAMLANTATQDFQVGANSGETISVDSLDMTAATGVAAAVAGNIKTNAAAASTAMDDIDAALDEVTAQRAVYGAAQNRFDSAIATLQISAENTSAAKGRIMDADFAVETSNLSRAQILQQAGNAMIAQANQVPNGVMALLKG